MADDDSETTARASRFRSAGPGPAVERGPAPLSPPSPAEQRVLTVPNAITLARLCSLPVFLWLLFTEENRVAAAILLGALGATDWVDGYIARRFDQASRLGRLFDPTADRILFFVAITAIIVADAAPLWFAAIVLAREVIVASITVTLLALGAPPVDVTWWGKAGTFAMMVAFPLFLAGSAEDFAGAAVCTALAWAWGLPGLVLSFVAWVRYVPLWQEAWRERQVLRAAQG
ncbi:MAG: CDP-alcohol phosphatidyltransferase family protein [Acidimicrobiia bacterium]|nr:CDP-alcohol phosphatidyltransferase family protein [Acidimicrobiia bacterium]